MGEASAPEKPMEASFHISPSLREQLLKALQASPAQLGNKMTYVVTGFWLCLEWLWQPPRALQALKELQLIS
jgi:hypothetical protein